MNKVLLLDKTTLEPKPIGIARTAKGGIVPRGNVARMVREGQTAALEKLGLTLGERVPVPEGKEATALMFQRVAGKVVEVHTMRDRPPIAPEPTLDERIAAKVSEILAERAK